MWSTDDEAVERMRSCTVVFVVLLTPSQRSRFVEPWYWAGGAIGRYGCTPMHAKGLQFETLIVQAVPGLSLSLLLTGVRYYPVVDTKSAATGSANTAWRLEYGLGSNACTNVMRG